MNLGIVYGLGLGMIFGSLFDQLSRGIIIGFFFGTLVGSTYDKNSQ